MSEPLKHPVLGLLVRDKFGERGTLRKFPFLPEFARSNEAPDDDDLPLLADWQRHIVKLMPRVRRFSLWGGLHRLGVFELYVDLERDDERPSAEQVAAFAEFVAREQEVCRNVVDALLRYYRIIRQYIPPLADIELPDDPDAAALAGVLEFDCMTVTRTAVAGATALRFAWRPAWDEEHGLGVLVYRGQVLMVGTDEVGFMESGPSDEWFNEAWNRSVMTPAEVAAYEAYCRRS